MAEQSQSERDVVARHLARAWQGVAPDPGLRDRVRARLTSSTAATMGAVSLGMASNVRPEGTWASLQASTKLGALLVGGGLLGLGTLSGYFIRASQETPVAVAAPTSQPVPLVTPVPVLGSAPLVVRDTTPTLEPPATSSAKPAHQRRPVAALARVTEPAAAPAGAPQPSGELGLLRRAERAVRADEAALALALIAELEASYPRSSLLEERRALELLAHCVAGATDARTRARRFLQEHPGSVYEGRIDEMCSAASAHSTATK